MLYYAAALFGIAVIAEVPGLGVIPAKAVETENVLFMGLLLAFIGVVLKRFARR